MKNDIQKILDTIPTDVSGKWVARSDLHILVEKLISAFASKVSQTPCPYEDEFAKQTYGHTWDMACVQCAKEIRKYLT